MKDFKWYSSSGANQQLSDINFDAKVLPLTVTPLFGPNPGPWNQLRNINYPHLRSYMDSQLSDGKHRRVVIDIEEPMPWSGKESLIQAFGDETEARDFDSWYRDNSSSEELPALIPDKDSRAKITAAVMSDRNLDAQSRFAKLGILLKSWYGNQITLSNYGMLAPSNANEAGRPFTRLYLEDSEGDDPDSLTVEQRNWLTHVAGYENYRLSRLGMDDVQPFSVGVPFFYPGDNSHLGAPVKEDPREMYRAWIAATVGLCRSYFPNMPIIASLRSHLVMGRLDRYQNPHGVVVRNDTNSDRFGIAFHTPDQYEFILRTAHEFCDGAVIFEMYPSWKGGLGVLPENLKEKTVKTIIDLQTNKAA